MLSETYAMGAAAPAAQLNDLRARIDEFDAMSEQDAMHRLMHEAKLDANQLKTTQELASRFALGVRKARLHAGSIDLLTQEFSLDSQEGIALMCLAEAMLRVPDTETRNKLIRDKVVGQDWRRHIGQSSSLFVNATAWGLALTGKLLKQPDEESLANALSAVLRRSGEGAVRTGVSFAMRLLGKQFVTGQTIEEAITEARPREKLGYRYSYDMLGETALTPNDADAYFKSYAHTIEMTGKAAGGLGPIEGPGVSVKLTGLHPRYEVTQHARVITEMYPRLLQLARAAKKWNIGFHLDQEEVARFPLTLEMLERLSHEPELAGWDGLGISLQAYQKRGRAVVDYVIGLARATNRRILVRLVKGAYWDTEVKRCQSLGMASYPVFTRKVHSDVSYLACAKALLSAQDAIFPQFATHNAFSIAAAHTLGQGKEYEFQCLHGMGETVYDQIVGPSNLNKACRVYAPVGPHATLLAYLVRRLIENGANTSFVNQVVDSSISIDEIVADPVQDAAKTDGSSNPAIPLPWDLLAWRSGAPTAGTGFVKTPDVSHSNNVVGGATLPNDDLVALAKGAVDRASEAGLAAWAKRSISDRANVLLEAAKKLEAGNAGLVRVLTDLQTLTTADVAEEVRWAADVCRFNAARVAACPELDGAVPIGAVAVIAPVTSPLAWSMTQCSAALAAGNPVVLKSASGTEAVGLALKQLLTECGVPEAAMQVVAGPGANVGAAIVSHEKTAAVVIGASREVTAEVTRNAGRAQPDRPVFARSAGFAAMLVDSSALSEQVISDAVLGAFDGAGARVNSLKLLCLQDVVADKMVNMLQAMLNERSVNSASDPSTDIGPVSAKTDVKAFEAYLEELSRNGHKVARLGRLGSGGRLVKPAIVELSDIKALDQINPDLQGPVLHIVRWQASHLAGLLQRIDTVVAPAYLGLHTRIYETAGEVLSVSKVPNIFVNRTVHSLRVGMQVDGSGPIDNGVSSIGPFFLQQLCKPKGASMTLHAGPFTELRAKELRQYLNYPVCIDGRLMDRRKYEGAAMEKCVGRLNALASNAPASIRAKANEARDTLVAVVRSLGSKEMPALMGEENTLVFTPIGPVYCHGPGTDAQWLQAMTAIACGNSVVLPQSAEAEKVQEALGPDLCRLANLSELHKLSNTKASVVAVMTEASGLQYADVKRAVLSSAGSNHPAVMGVQAGLPCPWWSLVSERQVTVNASASGDNTQLMMQTPSGDFH